MTRDRRRRRGDLQPRRPAGADARGPGRARPAAGRGDRGRQRQHRPHPRGARRRHQRRTWSASTPTTTSAGPAASTSASKAAYDQGFDRIWLMDDDVVPGARLPDVLLAQDEACLMAVREDTGGSAGREGGDPVRPDATRCAIRPKTRDGRDDVRHPGGDARAGRDRERRVRGLHGPPRRWSRRSGCPTRRTSSSTTTSTSPCAPAGPASGSGRSATPCWCASSTSTSSTTWRLEGLLHVPQPLRRALPVRRERAGAAQAVADHARPSCCSARCAAGGPRRGT